MYHYSVKLGKNNFRAVLRLRSVFVLLVAAILRALQWTPQGRRSKGRPRNTWKRHLKKEIWTASFRYSWRKMELAAHDRTGCTLRRVFGSLCSTGSDMAKVNK